MHFNNQTKETVDNHEKETENVVVSTIEKEETETMNDQKKKEVEEEHSADEQKPVEENELPDQAVETDDETSTGKEPEDLKEEKKTDEQQEEKAEQEEAEEKSETDDKADIPISKEEDESKTEQPDSLTETTSAEKEEKPEEEEVTEQQEASEEAAGQTETVEEKDLSPEPEIPQKEPETPEEESKPKTEEEVAREKEMAQYEETFRDYKPGEIIEGTIVGFNEKEVLVDISYKSEGSIPIGDFSNTEEIKLNSKIKVYINKVENSEGKVSLSKKIADFQLALDDLKEIYKNNETVNGFIRQRVKGGMIAEIKGLNAFLPGSQISIKPIPNLDQFIGKEVKFRIINIDEQKKNIIVSRKKVLEEEKAEKIKNLQEKIEVGAELDGEVKNITDYGAFIDLGGIDGLLHITDMSWGHINHPSEMLNIGDKVKVKVIGYDESELRVSLGLKQLVPHPWENVELKYEEGSKITGKVVNITPYGAFVELEPGVEGLVHVSEMSWTKKISNPRHILKVGDTVNAIVLSVSKDEQKISLGMKQMEPNPWLVIDERYPVGTIIKGRVKSLTSFGAFVEIEEDIDGLIHISDLSWTKRVYHPKEVLKKGQEVETVVLSVDKHLHRIALGMKQLLPDPWEELDQKLPINTEVSGTITKIIPKGVLVEIDVDGNSIEGFVPISHLAIPRLEKPDMAFNTGDEIPMKVIELDMENRRLILSIKAFFFSKEREALQEFLKKHEPEMRQKAKRAERKRRAEQAEKKEKPEQQKSPKQTVQSELKEEDKPEQPAAAPEEKDEHEIKTDIDTESETPEEGATDLTEKEEESQETTEPETPPSEPEKEKEEAPAEETPSTTGQEEEKVAAEEEQPETRKDIPVPEEPQEEISKEETSEEKKPELSEEKEDSSSKDEKEPEEEKPASEPEEEPEEDRK